MYIQLDPFFTYLSFQLLSQLEKTGSPQVPLAGPLQFPQKLELAQLKDAFLIRPHKPAHGELGPQEPHV